MSGPTDQGRARRPGPPKAALAIAVAAASGLTIFAAIAPWLDRGPPSPGNYWIAGAAAAMAGHFANQMRADSRGARVLAVLLPLLAVGCASGYLLTTRS